jgi:putative FmdB family regulatory protein
MYDYLCPHCGEAFEELRSISERATAPCPACGKTAEKQLSGFFTGGSSRGEGGASPSRGGGSCSIGGFGGG